MSALQLEDRLTAAVSMGENEEPDGARRLLVDLHRDHPDGSKVDLQCAWVHERLELGSTYRTLGDCAKAVATLTRGVGTCATDPDRTWL